MQYVICLRNQLIAGFDGIYQLSLPSIVDRWAGSISINVCIQPRNWHAVWNQWLKKKKKKENPFTATFIFVAAVHARLATVLTGPLCKLQSEAGPQFAGLFSGRGGEEGQNRAEVGRHGKCRDCFWYIYICVCVCVCVHSDAFSRERVRRWKGI